MTALCSSVRIGLSAAGRPLREAEVQLENGNGHLQVDAMEDLMWLKSLFCMAFALLVTANLAGAQFPGQGPTTPPTFPQQKSSDRADLIDINSASKEQLVTLPGVDKTLAGKIIESPLGQKKSCVDLAAMQAKPSSSPSLPLPGRVR